MTMDEEHYPPPRHRRSPTEPPAYRDDSLGHHRTDFDSDSDFDDVRPAPAPWFESDNLDRNPSRPRSPGDRSYPPSDFGHNDDHGYHPASATGEHHFVDQPFHTGYVAQPPTPEQFRPAKKPLFGPRNPVVIFGVVIALFAVAGLMAWMFSGSGGDQEITIGGAQDDELAGDSNDDEGADDAPLVPATLPQADEDGLVGMELSLLDSYTGTGSTGSVELYLNSLTGQVCHTFDVAGLTGRYQAYIHEADFPKEGPIVVDLGEVANSVPRCVDASPIDVSRALTSSESFYVAAHGPDRNIVLREQLGNGEKVFDNRDAELVASQEAAQESSEDGDDDLFANDEDGAYLVVDAGKVTFEGPVPDAETAEQLRSAFVPLSGMGVDVIDNLQVESGAPPPSGRVIVADALLFDSGQDLVSGDSPVLDTLADLMTVNPGWTMTITGHTDDRGDYLFNIELSLRRANNVRDRLADLDVPAERIRVQGAGPEQPIESNDTAEGRASNRRIEISIDS